MKVIDHSHISTVFSKLTWASNVFAVWHRLLEGHNTNPGDTSYRSKDIDFYYHAKGREFPHQQKNIQIIRVSKLRHG